MRPIPTVIFAATLAAFASFAPELRADEDATPEEVMVRGRATPAFVARARVEDAPREITDAASLVEWLPGVHVRRLGAADGFSTMSIRGSSSNQIIVYLAGVPLTGGADPTLDLSSLPLWPGARARAYRTFAPASLGQGSLGGTLTLDPPALGSEARSEVWASAGSFGSLRMRVADARPEAGVVTALSASRSDDAFPYYDELARRERRRENAGHAAANAMVSVVAPVDRRGGASVRSTTLLQARRQELPGTARVPTPEDRLDSTRLVTALELTVPVARGALVARGWGRRDDLRTASGGSVVAPARALSDDALTAIGTSVAFRRRGRGAAFDARADLIGERFAPGTRIGGPQPAGADRRAVGGGFDVELSELKPLTLNGSARLDVYADGADGEIARQDTLPTAHLGADLDLGPLSLVAHGGRVARPASFVERYGNRATFLGNPDLRFESAWAADAGLRAARRMGPLRARAELVGFATWATDLITFVPQGAFGLLRASNIGRAHVRGAEADVEAKLGGAELRAVYTLMATENQSLCTFAFSGAPCARPALPGRPAHDLFADVAYRFGRLRVRYGVDVVSGITTDLSATLDVPSRALHSVGASLEVPGVPGLRLAFDLRNLFDLRSVAYAGATGPLRRPIGDSYDFPIPGRNVLVTARWTSPAP